ncbi:hypothetical protein RB195_023721 [Necator americanus]|uniref:Uncharacterized protein n=1 Tax=Necator americanus TaxID=51031 RepID=A0ABR1EKB5_NECAM
MAGLKDEECRTKFRERVSIHVGVRTRKKLTDADSFTKLPSSKPSSTHFLPGIQIPGMFVRLLDDISQRTTATNTDFEHQPDVQHRLKWGPLTDLEYFDDLVRFAESSRKVRHVVHLVSKLAAAYVLRSWMTHLGENVDCDIRRRYLSID